MLTDLEVKKTIYLTQMLQVLKMTTLTEDNTSNTISLLKTENEFRNNDSHEG
jgi:hypothetical protein